MSQALVQYLATMILAPAIGGTVLVLFYLFRKLRKAVWP